MKQESSGCLELNSLFGCSINTKVFFWYTGILLKKKYMMNILNISFIEGIKTTGNRKKNFLIINERKTITALKM